MTDPSGAAPEESSLAARVFVHGGIYGLEHVLRVVVSFVMLPIYARYLGIAGYGTVGVLSSYGAVLSVLLLQGLGSAWFRLRVMPRVRERLPTFQTHIVLYLSGSLVVVTGLFFTGGPYIAKLLTPNLPFYPWWPWVFLSSAGSVYAALYKLALRGDQKPGRYIVFVLVEQVSTVSLLIFMLVILKAGPLGQLQAGAIATSGMAIISLYLLRPYRTDDQAKGDLKLAFSYGWPHVPHMLAGPLNNVIDRGIVNGFLGTAMAGTYIAGQQIAGLSQRIATSLNQAYAPIFNSMAQEAFEEDRPNDVYDQHMRSLADLGHIISLAMLVVGLVLIACSRELLLFLANPEFAAAWKVIFLLVSAEIMRTYYFVFGRVVFFKKESLRFAPFLSWSAMGINLTGNCILIPLYGIVGAGLATLLSHAFMMGMTLRLANRHIPIPYRWTLMIGSFLGFAGSVALLVYGDFAFESPMARIGYKTLIALPFSIYALVSIYRSAFRELLIRKLRG